MVPLRHTLLLSDTASGEGLWPVRSHSQLGCSSYASPAPCYPVLFKNNHLGNVNLTQNASYENKIKQKSEQGERPDVAVPRKSQRPGLSSRHALTLSAMHGRSPSGTKFVPEFSFAAAVDPRPLEGQWMVLESWWRSLELWGMTGLDAALPKVNCPEAVTVCTLPVALETRS